MQTFLSFESSFDDQIIASKENELAINALQENKKYVYLYGPNKSGKSSLAKKFSIINNKKLIHDIPDQLEFETDVYLDLNQLPLKSENFFHFLQYFISNNLNLTIFSNHILDIKDRYKNKKLGLFNLDGIWLAKNKEEFLMRENDRLELEKIDFPLIYENQIIDGKYLSFFVKHCFR